jgi:hypothetical protein
MPDNTLFNRFSYVLFLVVSRSWVIFSSNLILIRRKQLIERHKSQWRLKVRCPSVPVRLFMHLSSIIRTFVLSHRSLPLRWLSYTCFLTHALQCCMADFSSAYKLSKNAPSVRSFSHYPRTDIPSSQHSQAYDNGYLKLQRPHEQF